MDQIDESKFAVLDDLFIKGRLTTTSDVGGVSVGYRTLTHEEELMAVNSANNQPLAFKIEQLTLAITHLNGKKISDDFRERDLLRKKLGKLPSSYINAYFLPYAELVSKIPPIEKENIVDPLEKEQQLEQSTKSVLTVEPFQTTH